METPEQKKLADKHFKDIEDAKQNYEDVTEQLKDAVAQQQNLLEILNSLPEDVREIVDAMPQDKQNAFLTFIQHSGDEYHQNQMQLELFKTLTAQHAKSWPTKAMTAQYSILMVLSGVVLAILGNTIITAITELAKLP